LSPARFDAQSDYSLDFRAGLRLFSAPQNAFSRASMTLLAWELSGAPQVETDAAEEAAGDAMMGDTGHRNTRRGRLDQGRRFQKER
jgi:hypothetical protein